MSRPRKLLLVVNPKAGFGRAEKLLAEIRGVFDSRDIATEILITTHSGHASEQLAATDLCGYDGLVCVGGDGTIFDVLNGLYQLPREARVPLGVVPAGTGNAFARDLGLLPGDWRKAVAIIAAAQLRQVDVGQARTASEQFYFINVIGIGFVVDASLSAHRLKRLGAVAYTLGTLWQTLQLKSYSLRIEIDGETIERENLFVEISNTRYTGTSFMIAPGAAMDDGLLDVTLLRKLGRLRLLRLFPTVYSGRHVEYDEIAVLRGKSIRILEPTGYPMSADGEFRGTTPAEITCLHQDLTIFGP